MQNGFPWVLVFLRGTVVDVIADVVELLVLVGASMLPLEPESERGCFAFEKRVRNVSCSRVNTGYCMYPWQFLLELKMRWYHCIRACNCVNKPASLLSL